MTNLRSVSESLLRCAMIGTLACTMIALPALAQHRADILIFEPMLAAIGPHSCTRYPVTAVRMGEQGETFVRLTIATDGTVKNSAVAKSSGHDALDRATIDCTSTFAYKPIMKDGVPVETTAIAAIAWCLSEECRAFFTASPGVPTPPVPATTPTAPGASP